MAHHIHRLVVGKTVPTSLWWRAVKRIEAGGTWEQREFDALADLLAGGVFEQAQALLAEGDEVRGELGEWLEHKLATNPAKEVLPLFKKRLGLKVRSIGGHTATRPTGPQGLRVMLKSVDFTMTAKLDGPWIVGRNRIEGYGLIRVSRRIPIAAQEVAA